MERARKWYEKNKHRRPGYMLKHQYGITWQQYEEMLKNQNGVCAICGDKETVTGSRGQPRNLPVDHDHRSGKVRALLCYRCNSMIGYSREREDLLLKAIEYLRKHRG